MIAFVLSGGGNRGAAQAGALLALLERGIRPDLIIGTSVGAMNSAALALDPSVAGAQRLGQRWLEARDADIFPGGRLSAAWRVLTGKGGLHDRKNLRRFICATVSGDARHFADVRVPCLVTATVLGAGRLRLFGDDPRESLLDALLASTAIPPLFAPYRYRNEWLADGAIVANLPLGLALDRGADTIYALEIADDPQDFAGPSMGRTLSFSVRAMIGQQHELERRLTAQGRRGLTVHTLSLPCGQRLAYNDFSATPALIEAGYRSAAAYLDALPQPRPSGYRRAVAAARATLQTFAARARPQAGQQALLQWRGER